MSASLQLQVTTPCGSAVDQGVRMTGIVLVGVDSSDTALAAAIKAARLAAALGAELHIVHAYGVSTRKTLANVYDNRSLVPEQRRAQIKDRDHHMVDTAEKVAYDVGAKVTSAVAGVRVITRAVEGDPADVLIYEGEQYAAEVIVVGNRRVQGPTKVLGSIARSVASATTRDLYVANTHSR